MGLYSGDLNRLGMLTGQAKRAARLVIGTGVHAHGWSRKRHGIQRMRAHARSSLGKRFGIRPFHDTVLGSAPLPLSVLDEGLFHPA